MSTQTRQASNQGALLDFNAIEAAVPDALRTLLLGAESTKAEDAAWKRLVKNGATDDEIRTTLTLAIGGKVRKCEEPGSDLVAKLAVKPAPLLLIGESRVREGKALIEAIRDALEIGLPGESKSVAARAYGFCSNNLCDESGGEGHVKTDQCLDWAPDPDAGPEPAKTQETLARFAEHAVQTSAPAEYLHPPADDDGPEIPYRLIDLDDIALSSTNPRKHFDPAKMADLVESIKAKGVLQPVLVRPKAIDNCDHELVAGERRFTAAKAAGLAQIPSIVREMTDQEALEVQVIENLQRADLTPLEEAQGYRRLLDLKGEKGEAVYTADSLGSKVGKSRSYIYAKVKLMDLPPLAVEAMTAGHLLESTALLIARLPNEDMRIKGAAAVITRQSWYLREKVEKLPKSLNGGGAYSDYDRFDGPLPSRRAARELEFFTVELKKGRFNQSDANLLPAAGSCDDCPKKTGNNRDLYPDGRADICTDPGCFNKKVSAHKRAEIKAVKDAGYKVLPGTETQRLFSSYKPGELNDRTGYIDLRDTTAPAGKGKAQTYKQVLGDAVKEHTVAAIDRTGAVHYLVPVEKANPILKKAGLPTEKPAPKQDFGGGQLYQAPRVDAAAAKREAEIDDAIDLRVCEAIGARMKKQKGVPVELLRAAADSVAYGDVCDAAWTAHGVPAGWNQTDKQRAFISKADAPTLVALIAQLLAGDEDLGNDPAFSKWLDVDRKTIAAEVRAEFDTKDSEPKAAKVTKRAKAGKLEVKPVYGVCRKCGCTDGRGCYPDGMGRSCWWVDESHTLCSRCV